MKTITAILAAIALLVPFHFHAQTANKAEISDTVRQRLVDSLISLHGPKAAFRITRGVDQVAAFWRTEDGNASAFVDFCIKQFIADSASLAQLFNQTENNLASIQGHLFQLELELRVPLELAGPPPSPLQEILGAYSPYTHFLDDMFANKMAFLVLLNFPAFTLQEKLQWGPTWSREQWARARLTELFLNRTPQELNNRMVEALSASINYINGYNLYSDGLLNTSGQAIFHKKAHLNVHWGIRDELKAQYAEPDGLEAQKTLYRAMTRVIDQSIPGAVINNTDISWNPFTNQVYQGGEEIPAAPEADQRYAMLLDNFRANRQTDAFYPFCPDFRRRTCELALEMPEKELRALYASILTAPEIKKTAALIRKRLGRPLEAFDIWYDGFKTGNAYSDAFLSDLTRKKYPNAAAFEKDLTEILVQFGWQKERAEQLAAHVQVDPARGSGHAMPAFLKVYPSRLRTRVGESGMDYKGFNIAVHEFGHTVEQTIGLFESDHYLLHETPNLSFSEALAFLFQHQDMKLLGLAAEQAENQDLAALAALWGEYETTGVALLDLDIWTWMYEHPEATPAELKNAVLHLSKDIWNRYYAPVLSVKDEPLLAIYSHLIENPMYFSNYALGRLIEWQVKEYFQGKNFATEVERMYRIGKLTPNQWMLEAVGKPISTAPLLERAGAALKKYGY